MELTVPKVRSIIKDCAPRSTTLVVATKDSLPRTQNGADYRAADYATDGLAIQAAIDILP